MTLTERSKVNLDLWNLSIAIVSLDLTDQVKIMTGFNRIHKNNVSFFSNLNALGSKFDLDVK